MAKNKKRIPWLFILIGLFIPSLLLNLYLLFTKPPPSSGVKVIGVIDGDTIVLEGKSKVRLRYVDAPEKNLCGNTQATKELENLAFGKSVRIDEQIPDQYGRGMALVYDGNILINEQLLKSGWVRYHHDTSEVTNRMKQASENAKNKQLGIYGLCQSTENIQNPNCIIKGNIDKQSGAKRYYLPVCAQFKYTIVEKDIGEDWYCTEKDAQSAGFQRAETCG